MIKAGADEVLHKPFQAKALDRILMHAACSCVGFSLFLSYLVLLSERGMERGLFCNAVQSVANLP